MKITEAAAAITAMFCCVMGFMSVVIYSLGIIPYKSKKVEKTVKVCAYMAMVLGIYIFGSLIYQCKCGKHIDSHITQEVYDIETLATDYIEFNNGETLPYNNRELYVEIMKPDGIHNNIIIKETEEYLVNWIFYVKSKRTTYYIYLTDDVYKIQQGILYNANDVKEN